LKKNRILALIDGFNYYHRLDDYQKHFKECVKWLNYRSLVESWLQDTDDTNSVEIIYFSAIARHKNAETVNRHKKYIQALEYADIKPVLGNFKPKKIVKCLNHERCQNCSSTQDKKKLQRWEEKNTDVSIAITLLESALRDNFDKCFLLSSDSDFIPAIQRVKEISPEKKIIICPPPLPRKKLPLKREYQVEALEDACQGKALLTNFYTIRKHQFLYEYNGLENPWKV